MGTVSCPFNCFRSWLFRYMSRNRNKNSNSKKENKIIKYPKQYNFSIGFIVVGVMFIYMIFHLFTYVTDKNITVYEVSQGSISSNLEYNALAIRQEQIVNADSTGDILYIAENFSKVGAKSNVYALDTSGSVLDSVKSTSQNSEVKLNNDDLAKIQTLISNYTYDFDTVDYNKVYSFKTELESQVQQLYTVSAMEAMGDSLQAAMSSGTFSIYNSPVPGLVVYSIDGLENLSVDSFLADTFDMSQYSSVNLKSQGSVNAGEPVYKVITSDHWNLIVEVDKALYKDLKYEKKETYLNIRFLEDENETWTNLDYAEKDGKYYFILTLDDSMDRYADSRYVHIKILNNNVSGLKIPNSSIVKKKFFTIPKSCVFQGNNGDEVGFMLQSSEGDEYITPTIYFEKDDYYYIDNEKVSKGDILLKPNSDEKYVVGSDIKELDGVYNVNKGYAVFKQIEYNHKGEEYSIIKTGTKYGISMYDHIVLQGDEVEENTIIN